MKNLIIAAGAILVLTLLVVVIIKFPAYNNPSSSGNANIALQTGPAPWATSTDNLKARLDKDNLPALSQEGVAMHIHQHLDIFANGLRVDVPGGIGINGWPSSTGFISALHTHDSTGVMHVESPIIRDFTLGQFFDVWGVRFDQSCLGGYCTNAATKLHVYINGTEITSGSRDQVLKPHQEIVIIYSTDKDLPKSVPSTYTFPLGE